MNARSNLAVFTIGLLLLVAGMHCTAGAGGSKFMTGGAGGTGNTAGSANGGAGNSTASGLGGGSFATASASTGAGGDPSNPYKTHPICGTGQCLDFPMAPIMGTGVPSNAPALFGAASNFTAGALCVLEPQLSANGVEGAMIPANWVRPRFRWNAPAGLDLFEVRINSPAEKYELVLYTKQTTWYLPKDIWAGPPGSDAGLAAGTGLANNAAGTPLTVTIRGVDSANPGTPVGVQGDFNIAPVIATGSMVFWTVNSSVVTPQSSKLLGFSVGDEGVDVALGLTDLKWGGQIGEDGAELRGYYDNPKVPGFVDGQVRCMGCHTSTPDGQGVVFTDDWPWAKGAAMVSQGNTGTIPSWLGAGAQAVMKMPWWGTQTMSKAHFAAGDRVLVTSYATTFQGAPPAFTAGQSRTKPWQALPNYNQQNPFLDDKVLWHKLAWIDLESTANINVAVTDMPDYGQNLTNRENQGAAAMGTAYGLIATGDTGVSDVSPAMSHDGTKIVYVATDFSPDGHPDYTATKADVKVVDYNNRQGGTATPLAGASDPADLEYYPSFSADDKLIAFTRAPQPGSSSPDGPYYNRFGEIRVVPAGGGTPTKLAANDPNACAGDNTATGIINSWPKWSPDVVTVGTKTYYFLVFSSARKYADEFSSQFTLAQNPLSDFKGLNISSQLYLAAIVVDSSTNTVTTYPAVYIWNQNRTPGMGGMGMGIQYSNLTPAWDPFQLPPLVIQMVPPTQ